MLLGCGIICMVGLCGYHKGCGVEILREMGKGSPVLVEMGLWECFLCVWAILVVLSLIVVSMERIKNTGKGKAANSSMERAVKKRKADTSQVVKKSKGKHKNQSSEDEEESEDEEIEEMFDESAEAVREKWAHSIAKRGFHYERGMEIENFIFDHPIHAIIEAHKLQFFLK